MASVVPIERRLPLLDILSGVVAEVDAATKRLACRLVLALGLGNLFVALVHGGNWLPTSVALDLVYANFAGGLWIVTAYWGIQPPLAGLAAKVLASTFVVVAMITSAGLVAIPILLWRGTAPVDWPLVLAGLYANLGVGTLHLILLAVAMQAIFGRRWLSLGTTAAVWIGSNLGFDHLLLRFGAPISPVSAMNGFSPFLASHVTAGIHWTGLCVVLLAAGRWVAGRRSAKTGEPARRPLGPNAFAFVWTAGVAWVVSGGWILHDTNLGENPHIETDRVLAPSSSAPPQPDYSRLDLDIVISPLERILAGRGTAIAVNRRNVPIPELHFGIPRALEVVALNTTAELIGIDGATGCHRYRLNRPLEPKETLKIEFDLKWTANGFALERRSPGLLENGTFVSTAEVVPALGCSNGPHPFRNAPPVAYRARISTSLDQTAVTAGTLIRAWKEDGWSFFEYESQGPISPFATIHSGHYAIRREVRDHRLFEVFYHPKHWENVDRMIDAGRAAVAKRSKSAIRQGIVRIVEVPDYLRFRRLGFLGVCVPQTPMGGPQRSPLRAYAAERPVYETTGMVLPYSERGYPLSTPPPSESTPPRA